MNYSDYIGDTVLVRSEEINDFSIAKKGTGTLQEVRSYIDSQSCVDELILDFEGNNIAIPTNSLLQFLPYKLLNCENTEYYYVVIRFGKTERSKEHIYMSYDYSIKPGDKVLVWQDWLYVGNVIRTGFYKKENAPYPIDKTFLIEKRVFDRIDFMQYADSFIINAENLYKNKFLNSENDYRQFVAKVTYCYQWFVDDRNETVKSRNLNTPEAIINYTKYELDWEWCESNQMDVFYRTLWLCSQLVNYNYYEKFLFDKYKCLSLIYKHGDFDDYLLSNEDKLNIERDIRIIDCFINEKAEKV